MAAFFDVSCVKCGRRFGWTGESKDCPPCPGCGYAIPIEQLQTDEEHLQDLRNLLRERHLRRTLVTGDLVSAVRGWLGEEGVAHFRRILEMYGTVNAVWDEGGVRHSIHLREGVSVRIKLRELTNNSWEDQQYGNLWKEVIKRAIV